MIFIAGIALTFIIAIIYPEAMGSNFLDFIFYGSFVLWIISIPIRLFGKIIGGFRFGTKELKKKRIGSAENELLEIDSMDGHEFEYWCANLLRGLGYKSVTVTPGSGDQGADIIAVKDGVRCAFQCKRYSSNLGNKPVQEVLAGIAMYDCSVGVVITNQYFTQGAIDLANKTGVQLWSRNTLKYLIEQINKGKKEVQAMDMEYFENLPHVPVVEGQVEYANLYYIDEVVDPYIFGDDDVLSLASEEFEEYAEAEHLSKAIEKHFYARVSVEANRHSGLYFVRVEVRARNIRSNFRGDHFVAPNWA